MTTPGIEDLKLEDVGDRMCLHADWICKARYEGKEFNALDFLILSREVTAWRALRASPPPLDSGLREVVDGWQPIETAREADRVFLWCADERKGDDGKMVPTGLRLGRIHEDGTPQADGMSGDWTFTHWMPLPEPPSVLSLLPEEGAGS